MENKVAFYTTPGIAHALETIEGMKAAVNSAVARFIKGEWGELPEEDIEANNSDLRARDGHVLAKYTTPGGNIYIDMEFGDDQDNAVIMFCDEY